MKLLAIDETGPAISWVLDEAMQRASHAIAADGRVWFVDPVDVPEAIDRALALGEPAGVIQLLDRHGRDNEALAERFGVPFLRLPDAIPASPFEVFDVLSVPKWREKGLWWPERRALVIAEAVGTVTYFRVAARHAGIHPFLRGLPPKAPRRFDPEHLLCGHGSGVHGPDARAALDEAYHRSLRDLPRLPLAMLRG